MTATLRLGCHLDSAEAFELVEPPDRWEVQIPYFRVQIAAFSSLRPDVAMSRIGRDESLGSRRHGMSSKRLSKSAAQAENIQERADGPAAEATSSSGTNIAPANRR